MTHKRIESISQFDSYFHQPTYHPLVSVGNLADADASLFLPLDFGMYCVVLMDASFGQLKLHGEAMHYHPGAIFTMKPGDVVSLSLTPGVKPKGWMLVFRPELLNGTGLERDFYMFNFFDFKVAEALELCESERRVALNCFFNIKAELEAPNDEYTSHMLRLGIGTMLTCCKRFYERQFDTRQVRTPQFVSRLEALIDNYFAPGSPLPRQCGQPTVAWCAEQFNLSPGHFGDTLRRQLGMTAQAFIQQKIIERGKALLARADMSVNDVAFCLGFEYPNHFTRFFRSKTGVTPTVFRKHIQSDN